MKLHFSNKKHLDGERIARSTPLFSSSSAIPTSFFLVSTLARPAISFARISFSPSLSFASSPAVLYSFLSRCHLLSSWSLVSVFIAQRNHRVPEKAAQRGGNLATEPMNRFFQRRPEGTAPASPTRIAEKEHVELVFQLKALIAVFAALLFGRKELLLLRSVAPASRRACGFTAATSYFIVLFNCLTSLLRRDPVSHFALFSLDSSWRFFAAVFPQRVDHVESFISDDRLHF